MCNKEAFFGQFFPPAILQYCVKKSKLTVKVILNYFEKFGLYSLMSF